MKTSKIVLIRVDSLSGIDLRARIVSMATHTPEIIYMSLRMVSANVEPVEVNKIG
jgi:hypothetical protein